jgi:hypothetical protein
MTTVTFVYDVKARGAFGLDEHDLSFIPAETRAHKHIM